MSNIAVPDLDDLIDDVAQPKKTTSREPAPSAFVPHVLKAFKRYEATQDDENGPKGIRLPQPLSVERVGNKTPEFTQVANELRRAGAQVKPNMLYVRTRYIYEGAGEGKAYLWFTAREQPWRTLDKNKNAAANADETPDAVKVAVGGRKK
jgi:hypothetical protein